MSIRLPRTGNIAATSFQPPASINGSPLMQQPWWNQKIDDKYVQSKNISTTWDRNVAVQTLYCGTSVQMRMNRTVNIVCPIDVTNDGREELSMVIGVNSSCVCSTGQTTNTVVPVVRMSWVYQMVPKTVGLTYWQTMKHVPTDFTHVYDATKFSHFYFNVDHVFAVRMDTELVPDDKYKYSGKMGLMCTIFNPDSVNECTLDETLLSQTVTVSYGNRQVYNPDMN